MSWYVLLLIDVKPFYLFCSTYFPSLNDFIIAKSTMRYLFMSSLFSNRTFAYLQKNLVTERKVLTFGQIFIFSILGGNGLFCPLQLTETIRILL